MLKSMRSRMTLRFVLLLIPFLLGTSYMVVMISSNAAEREARENVVQLKNRAIARIKGPDGAIKQDWKIQLDELASGTTFRQNQAGILVREGSEVIWSSSGSNKPPSFMNQPIDKWPKDWFDKWRVVRDRIDPYRISVVTKRKPIDSPLPMTLTGLGVIIVTAAAVGTWFMVGRVLSPIRLLARQTSTATANHQTVRLQSPSQDAEMTDLVDTLNGLLDRIYQEAELKGRFYAAASHELRTPLQALSGHLELSLSRKRTVEEYEEVVKESYTQARRLISLTQSLLFLHQVDSRTDANQQAVSLSEACESALEMTYSQMSKRHLKLEESIQPNIEVMAVPSHAEVLARNLIENASKYATEGGVISIVLRTVDGQVTLEVENEFPESIKIATQNIFQPFYRDDTSRNSKTGGNGLGLAICRAITVANGWEVGIAQEGGRIKAKVNFGSSEPKLDPSGKKKAAAKVGKAATA